MGQPKVQQMTSIKALRSHVKKKSGGNSFIQFVPKEGIIVRFLTEPDKWAAYEECWDDTNRRSFPYADHLVEGVDFTRKSTKYLANAVVVSDGKAQDKVVPFQMVQTVVNPLINQYDKRGTIMDRNYEIDKQGSGKETEYFVTPEAPSKMQMAKYELHDLTKVVKQAFNAAFDIDDDDDEDEEAETLPVGKKTAPPGRRKQQRGSIPAKKKKVVTPEPEEEDESDVPSEEEMFDMEWSDLCALARQWGVDPKEYRSRKTLIPQIIATAF